MTLSQQIAVCLSLTLSVAAPAYADGPSIAAVSAPAPAAPSGRWTKDDVATLCHSRFGTDDRSHGYLACVDRNSAKIGRDETSGEIQQLDAAKAASSAQ